MTLAGPSLEGLLSKAVPVQSLWLKVWPYFQWLLAAMLTFAAIELFCLQAPNVPVAHRITIPGALFAASAWLLLAWALGFYLHYFGAMKLDLWYGVLAAPIAFISWLYSAATIILMGAEINTNLQSYRPLNVRDPEKDSRLRTDVV